VREHRTDLVIALGDSGAHLELRRIASCALIRVFQINANGNERESQQLVLEYLERNSPAVFPIASLKVPIQTYDTQSALALKLDMMADDLIVQTVISLRSCNVLQALQEVDEWIRTIFTPYLSQLQSVQQSPAQIDGRSFQVCRSRWKLCLDMLLLCSPLIAGRNWYRRWRNRYPVLILTHHLISDRPHRLGLSTAVFWRLVRFVKDHYRIVSLSDAVKLLASGKVESPTVAFTFDDGYGENFVNLRAVAEEEGIPLALFLATDPVERHCEFEHDVMSKTSEAAEALPLTWEQIRYWASRGTEFGSHTRTHFDCGSIDRKSLEEEIVGSKRDLENRVGKTVYFFAFPFGGQRNISSAAMEVARTAYPYVVSSFGGENLSDAALAYHHLRRKNLYSHPWELELELQSVFDLVARIKGKVRFRRGQRARGLNEFARSSALTVSRRP
jgi:peptidoglycan/xylan/chitin deacetylase (PgdA/CDA1 family)